MRIIVKSDALLKALEAIDMVPSRSGIVPSEFVQIQKKGNKLSFSLASEVFGKTLVKGTDSTDGDWVFHVDRTSLMPFVFASKNIIKPIDYVLECEEKKDNKALTIKSGRRRVKFNAITFVQGYPTYASTDALVIPLTKHQKSLLQLASEYATSDPTLGYINCVYALGKRAILASNRITLFYGADKLVPFSVPLPIVLLGLIKNDRVRSVEVSKTLVKLELDCGYICQAINATAKKDFPVKQTLSQMERGSTYHKQLSLKAKPFLTALSRLQDYIRNVVNRELIVVAACSKNDTRLRLYCDTPQGRFQEIVTMLSPAKQDTKCEWLLTSLTPLSKYDDTLSRIDVRFDDKKKSPYHLVSPKGIQIMLGRRS